MGLVSHRMERRAVVTDICHFVRDDQMSLQSAIPVPARPADAIERVSRSLVWCMENSYLMLDSPDVSDFDVLVRGPVIGEKTKQQRINSGWRQRTSTPLIREQFASSRKVEIWKSRSWNRCGSGATVRCVGAGNHR